MHDNAIHDLPLAGWSVWLYPIKRAAVKTNLAYGESCLRLVFEMRVLLGGVSILLAIQYVTRSSQAGSLRHICQPSPIVTVVSSRLQSSSTGKSELVFIPVRDDYP